MPRIVWQFVDKPEKAANTLLDMNQSYGGNKIILNFGRRFNISAPPLKRSFAVNSLTHGGQMTSSAFENRVLQFSVSLQGTLSEKLDNFALLKRELGKERNLLMYSPNLSESEPVFFRTFKSDDYELVNQSDKGAWHVDCNVVAEPFAISEMVTLPQVIVSNDPLGTNGQRLDFPDIQGDVATPAFVHFEYLPNYLARFETFYLASRTHHNQFFNHARQFVAGDFNVAIHPDTSVISNAAHSGGNALSVSFATQPGLSTRFSFNTNQIPDVFTKRGRYRVLLRVRASAVPSTYVIRLRDMRFATELVYSRTIEWAPEGTNWDYLDFGVFNHPAYQTPNEFGFSGQPPGVHDMDFNVEVQRLTGTGNFEADFAVFLPAEDTLLMLSTHQAESHVVLDGPNEMAYGMYQGSPFNKSLPFWYYVSQGSGVMPWRGAIPDLVPHKPNTWYMFTAWGNMSDSFEANVYYWPRWMEVSAP